MIKEASWRAVRTFGQTFFGTLVGVQVTIDISFAKTAVGALVSSAIAAGAAFFMNLERDGGEQEEDA